MATVASECCCHSVRCFLLPLHRSSAATVQSGGRNGIDTAESDDSYATGNCARLGKAARHLDSALLQHARTATARVIKPQGHVFSCAWILGADWLARKSAGPVAAQKGSDRISCCSGDIANRPTAARNPRDFSEVIPRHFETGCS